MEVKIYENPSTYDSDDVRFINDKGEEVGFGYRSKEDGNFGLIRCPECGKENYVMNVTTGTCSWCPFKIIE